MINKNFEILICGAGTIGLRHANNLLDLGYNNIIFFTKRKKLSINKKKFKCFKNIKKVFRLHNPKIAFITNETNKHTDTAIKCANQGSHLFIEKPLANKNNRVKELLAIVKRKKLTNMVGYMMRFHPGVKTIKKIINKKKLGKIYHFYSEWGEFLPYWHKGENYKRSYAAQKIKGGGVTLTLSHDIDLMQYFFGKAKKSFLIKNKVALRINSETNSNLLIEFPNKINGFIHLDYLQKKSSRYLRILGSNLIIEFFYLKNLLKITKQNKVQKIQYKNFSRNQLFKDEIKYFLEKFKKRQTCSPSIKEAYSNLKNLNLI